MVMPLPPFPMNGGQKGQEIAPNAKKMLSIQSTLP
jgi:hypothetical protein